MKNNRALIISLLANVALLGAVLFLLLQPSAPAPSVLDSGAPAGEPAPQRFEAPPSAQAPPLSPSVRFDWRQVESADYKQYLANLRAIGCPERTIRDIITADVNDLYAGKRAAVTGTNHYEYWRATPVKLTTEQKQRIQELSAEKTAVLQSLGAGSHTMESMLGEIWLGDLNTEELKLEFLPEAKRQAFKDLVFRTTQQQAEAGDDQAKMAAIEKESQEELKVLLSPEEFHEFELRQSLPAAQLREALKELQPTEQEFRAIFDSWTALQSHTPGTPDYLAARQTGESALQATLGPARFEAYLKGMKLLGYPQ